jgi:NRPS condensation-like uncharacterized protein
MATSPKHSGDRTSIKRPLGGTEKIYWLLDKLYSLNFAAYVELDGKLDPKDLQTALSEVQHATPLLRSRIVVESKKPAFEPVDPKSYPLQLEVLALRGWRRQLEQQLDTPFPNGTAPLARFLWFRGKAAKSIVAIVFHHPIADGRSGVHILLQILRRAAGTAPAIAQRPARPSVQELDYVRQKHPVTSKLKEVKFWLAKGRELLSMASQLPGYDMNASGQRETASIELAISKSRSKSLLTACRAHKTSVHGAIGAAQVLALNDEFGARKARVMALNSLADLRGVIDGDLSEEDLGLYVSTLTTVHSLDASPDFWRLATEVRDNLQRIITSGDADLIHSFYPGSALFTPDERGARKVQNIVALAPPSSMLTNIGRIDEVDLGQGLAVREAGFLLSPPAQYPICITASSYRGGMLLNLLYDRGKISQTQAKRIAGNLQRHLEEAAQT